jgi:S-adenosylmethionine hydrolase
MKGVILSINPNARIVDITHGVSPQNIRQAAVILADATRHFPPDSVHLAVVDPGVGTSRKIVFARMGGQNYIAPDNGVLSRLAAIAPPSKIVTVTDRQYWLPEVSPTFHGRDIMAPVAAQLSLGLAPDALGPPQTELVALAWPEACTLAGRIEGEVICVDSFGNLITNITAEMLEGVPRDASVVIACDTHETMGIFTTYADQPDMTLIALVGSSGQLELAIVNDSAADMLSVREGAKVTVTW